MQTTPLYQPGMSDRMMVARTSIPAIVFSVPYLSHLPESGVLPKGPFA
jgi:hypothetical protein